MMAADKAVARGVSPAMNLRRILLEIALILGMVSGGVASAQVTNGGSVVNGEAFTRIDCPNRYFVYTPDGYSIITWLGGTPVIDRDVLDGTLENVGRVILTDKTRNQPTIGYVEDSHLSGQGLATRQRQLCH